jgi:hypothetical protein
MCIKENSKDSKSMLIFFSLALVVAELLANLLFFTTKKVSKHVWELCWHQVAETGS